MQPRFVDLHTHTTASDGTDAPRDLIRRAASLKIAAVAVTDHDTVSGLDEAEAAGREYGVEIIRGCELGVQGQYGEIHLLGLWLPRHSAPLDAELSRLRGHREERNLKILDRLRSIGINIGYQEVLDEAGGESVGRPHIARVLQKRGIVSNFAQAFELYLGYYGAAYVPRTLLTPEEGVSLMADLGAVVSFGSKRRGLGPLKPIPASTPRVTSGSAWSWRPGTASGSAAVRIITVWPSRAWSSGAARGACG